MRRRERYHHSHTVRLVKPSVFEIQSSLLVGFSNELCLHLTTWLRHSRRSAVLVRPAGADDGSDWVSVVDSIGQPFDQNDSEALATRIAAGAGVEGVAPPRRREETHIDQGKRAIGCKHETGTSNDRLLRWSVTIIHMIEQ